MNNEQEEISADNKKKKVVRRASPVTRRMKVGRNDPCPCRSGKKYKKCCLN